MNYIFKELSRHKWRTYASISGYLTATFFILLLLSVTGSYEKGSIGILRGTGTHFIVYVPSNTTCCTSNTGDSRDGSLIAEGVYTMMLNSDLLLTIRQTEGVRDAAPYLLYRIYDEKLKSQVSLGGVDTNSIATQTNVCAATNVVSGKYISGATGEIVAEESFARAHGLSVGDTLETYGSRLLVAGIVNSGIKPGKADLYAPIENVRAILRDRLKCISEGFDMNIVLVEVKDSRIQNKVLKQLRERLSYLAVSSYNCYKPASDVLNMMEGASRVLAVVIFLFLIIFSAKTQLTSLMERFREVGILKSLGWSDHRLGRQIMLISLIQSLCGAILGIMAGILLILILQNFDVRLFNTIEFQLHPESIYLLILLPPAGGLIAGIFPLIKLYRTPAGDMINNYL